MTHAPQHAYLDSRWSRLAPSTRAGVLTLLLGIGIFVGARIDDRRSCIVLGSKPSGAAIVAGPKRSTPSASFPVHLGKGVDGTVGTVWILDRRDGRRWVPAWQLIASVNGGPGDVRSISDGFDIADVGLGGPQTIAFRFPDGLRSGAYRLRPDRNAETPAVELEIACRSGLIAEWYGKAALALHS